jgi:hypothetical protein
MIAGPQFITAVFFATSEKWKSDSAECVAGAANSVTAGYKASEGVPSEGRDWMNANSWIVGEIVLVLFIVIISNSLAS